MKEVTNMEINLLEEEEREDTPYTRTPFDEMVDIIYGFFLGVVFVVGCFLAGFFVGR